MAYMESLGWIDGPQWSWRIALMVGTGPYVQVDHLQGKPHVVRLGEAPSRRLRMFVHLFRCGD